MKTEEQALVEEELNLLIETTLKLEYELDEVVLSNRS